MSNHFTGRAQNALNLSLQAAAELGDTYVGSEHLLLGLLSEPTCIAAKLLIAKGAEISKLRAAAPDENFYFLQTDAVKIDDFVFIGSRGWACPGSPDYTEQDQKLYLREAERFRLAFADAEKWMQDGEKKVALIHYPPFSLKNGETLFTEIFEKNGVEKVVFGHIHGAAYFPLKTEKNGVEYILASCDKVAFKLVKVY